MEHDAKTLWGKFAVLTEEMRKFLTKEDIDQYLELERQRNTIFGLIQDLPEDSFRTSKEGEDLLARLKPVEESMLRDAQIWLNKSRAHNTKVQGYGNIGGFRPQGNIFNKGY